MPIPSPLVDGATLETHLDDPALRLFDATAWLDRPPGGGPYAVRSGRDDHAAQHLPGARFADVPGALSDPDAAAPFTLPTPERFAAEAGVLGIGAGTHVVAYAQASPMWATRLWWLLRAFGFDAVSVLDGGLPAWLADGRPVSDAPAAPYPAAVFPGRFRPELVASLEEVRAIAEGDAPACLVNALPPATFRGEGPSSYSRAGRIPRSASAPAASLLDEQTRFLPADALRDRLAEAGALGDEPVVAYCGGGISATVDLLALAVLGRDDARLYDGSLTEWTRRPELPVEVG